MEQVGKSLIPIRDVEAGDLRGAIDRARSRLAEIEAAYTVEQRQVHALRALLFERLAEKSRVRDRLRILIRGRTAMLDNLRKKDTKAAQKSQENVQAAWEQTDRQYENARAEFSKAREVSPEDEAEIASLWRQLVKLYHPDRLGEKSEMREAYHKLISAINHARDMGDVKTLRLIAADPQGFLSRRGWGTLDIQEDRQLDQLKKLLASLEAEIVNVKQLLSDLRKSPDYELHTLIQKAPELFEQVVQKQLAQIQSEIAVLEAQAACLKTEIETITGAPLEESR